MQNKQLFSSINPERTSERLKMKHLVDELNEASNAYYNGQDEIMTNKEFDDKLEELKKIEEEQGYVLLNSPTHKVGYEVVDSLPKFKHPYPALSLDKTKDIDEFVGKFKKGISDSGYLNTLVVLMYKEDGSTVQAYYKHGELDALVTRGNGEIGSVITHNAKVLSGLPLKLPYDIDLVVRGEAVMSYQEFERINSELLDEQKYANPRNLAAATLTMLDSEEASKRHLMFQAFNLVDITINSITFPLRSKTVLSASFAFRLETLKALQFNVVPYKICEVDELSASVEVMTNGVSTYAYPVDGLVAAMDNYGYSSTLIGTEHHPNIMQGYAFKWADECKETVLREIEWSPSRTGRLNPVAIFDPIELEGTTVTRASLHNLSIMRKMRIHVGNRLSIFKSNMIIPYVDKNLDYENESDYGGNFIHSLIPFCPTCGAEAEIRVSPDGIETVYCPNEDCPEKMIGKFVNFCSRDAMDIQGMSEETIKKLVDAGIIKEYADFFKLDEKPGIASLPGFGDVSWRKMCQAANDAKEGWTSVRFLIGMNIPNFGKGQAKLLRNYIADNYSVLCNLVGLEENESVDCITMLRLLNQFRFDFTVIDGFGPIIAKDLSDWLDNHLAAGVDSPEIRIYDLLPKNETLIDFKPSSQGESKLSGKSFCITGKLEHFSNRQELVSVIESNGGKWIDSVSGKTDYLINNDVTSTSGKNKKAKELNIPIISENDFLQMVGG